MSLRHKSEIGPLVKLFLLLEAVATLLDVLMGVGSQMSTEETYNAAAAALIACGHQSSLWALQYKWFCGGCSAEALMAAPLFSMFSPSVLAWKWVMGTIHMVVVSAGAAIAGRAGGARSAFVFVGLMIAAPGFYRNLALTGFGNHAESSMFPFLAAGLMLYAYRRGSHARLLMATIAGVWMGLGVWFTPTSLHGFVAVTAVAVWAGRKPMLGYLAGLSVGMLPFVAYFEAVPHARVDAFAWWSTWEVAPLEDMVRWLVSDFVTSELWAGVPTIVSASWWFLLVVIAIIGMGALFIRKDRPWAVRWFVPLLLMGLLSAYFFRFDLWDDNPIVRGFDPFNMRYRAPLFPILALAAAMTSGVVDDASIFRRISAAVVVVLIASGFALRAGSWHIGTEKVHKVSAVPIDGRVDWSVPEGEPPQRLARTMGRPEDVEAALEFLESHDDGLAVCTDLHHAELGRRVALALMGDRFGSEAQGVLLESAAYPSEKRDALVRGMLAVFLSAENPTAAWRDVKGRVVAQNARLGAEISDRLGRMLDAMGSAGPE